MRLKVVLLLASLLLSCQSAESTRTATPPPTHPSEGWVVITFSVTPEGTVENATVLSAHAEGVFEEAALQAVRKWRYEPKIENGEAVWRRDLKVRLSFYLH